MKLIRSWVRTARHAAELLQKAAPSPLIQQATLLEKRPVRIDHFGPDPGRLNMFVYPPSSRQQKKPCPLLILLHGCGQNAEAFAAASGWITLAERLNAPLILPVQSRTNHTAGCFHWFRPEDIGSHGREAISILSMIRYACTTYPVDPDRIHIAGLSAGAAMAAAMLATYPDIFASGMLFAGLPINVVKTPAGALSLMKKGLPVYSDEYLEACARVLAPSNVARWPRISIWHGLVDGVVSPLNAGLLARQFLSLHRLPHHMQTEMLPEQAARLEGINWQRDGETLVSLHLVPGLGHAIPTNQPWQAASDPYVQPVAGVDAADHAAGLWKA
ncbi:extracellular catalytic domain type 1 short-chain-length polyhydroxyalkanoate depolymerase [Granulibacter bethesdensis]|uniref:Poly(3-hydroxyalkanoate) depolymerase n=1 Tax=Granulibacter bethesdensis (strain ATCC BAA-1260 / CGDNIH1) TaxID=391165 RepID=Q0BT40_GRABC|nr:PHB depolymerase family esterase [Granulibacter bethesdensis]ABI62012.1 Poly(3-hydroxyalkanoate) depolymerase [Granulibacter bethesdensis CGDNIH1]APH51832.1 Poly(3-hydroxyalkanoate) depolymerase [Granulibacter bethesdensis]APH64523.1 Poly(3-hydroxyalkanoate) depolymerase [Granulibacter bethesdensis]